VELLVRAAISGILIAVASEAARRSSLLGAVVISLPLTSLLAITWLYRDTRDTDDVASFAWSILWIVPPSLVFFVVLPLALGRGVSFVPAVVLAAVLTAAAYGVWVAAARALGIGD
jgi:F0F1-type ATP synthase assembly protein I